MFDNIHQSTDELRDIYHAYQQALDRQAHDYLFSQKLNEIISLLATVLTLVQSENDIKAIHQDSLADLKRKLQHSNDTDYKG